MKLKVKTEILLEYGFEIISDEYKETHNIDEYHPLDRFDGLLYNLGHSRRGQSYYLLCSNKNGTFSLYSSEPDGSGGILELDSFSIFSKLIKDGLV